MWTPKDTFDNRSNTCVKRSVRRYPESALNGFGLWAGLNEWFHGLGPSPSTNDLVSSFTADVNAGVDHFFRPILFDFIQPINPGLLHV